VVPNAIPARFSQLLEDFAEEGAMGGQWLPQCLHWPFGPGVFIAILAGLAAAVTFRKEPGRLEKAAWIIVFFSLMWMEVWMVGIDRQSHEYQEAQASHLLLKGFSNIGDGIKKSIAQSDQHFEATIGKTNKVLQNITGGDSFGFVVPQVGGVSRLPLLVWNHGDQPLIGVTITMAHTQDSNWEKAVFNPIFIGTIGPHDHLPVPRAIVPHPDDKNGVDVYWVMISAQNGTVSQTLFLRKNRKLPQFWAYSYIITKAVTLNKARGTIPKGATMMEPLLRRDWSDEVDALH